MIPLHPKRHLVAPRKWSEEPQDRYRYHLAHIASMTGGRMDPHTSGELLAQAQFNVTAPDTVRF